MHPARRGHGESIESLAEVLDHVVAFELAVDQDVETDVLLEPHGLLGLGLEERVIRCGVALAAPVLGAGLAHVGGLRKRPDRRGRKRG